MKNIWYLVSAYSVIWFLLAYYFIKIGGKVKSLEKRLAFLEDHEESENK